MNILNAKLNFDMWSELTHESFEANVPSLMKENFLLKECL